MYPESATPIVRFERLPGAFSDRCIGRVDVRVVDGADGLAIFMFAGSHACPLVTIEGGGAPRGGALASLRRQSAWPTAHIRNRSRRCSPAQLKVDTYNSDYDAPPCQPRTAPSRLRRRAHRCRSHRSYRRGRCGLQRRRQTGPLKCRVFCRHEACTGPVTRRALAGDAMQSFSARVDPFTQLPGRPSVQSTAPFDGSSRSE